MTRTRWTRTIAAALGALAAAAAAHGQKAAPPNSTIDILGLRTGMTEAELREALGKAGFSASDTAPGASGAKAFTRSSRLVLNQLDETKFLSSIVARKVGAGSSGPIDDTVMIAMLPHGNEPRAWAIRRMVRYLPSEAPSHTSTVQSLTAKYGALADTKPNNTVHWWWNAAGNQLPAKPRPECERAIHDTQMFADNGGTTRNLAALRAPPFPAIAKADCVYGVRANMQLDASRKLVHLDVLAVALKDANEASLVTGKIVGDLTAAAQQKAKAAADARKPDL